VSAARWLNIFPIAALCSVANAQTAPGIPQGWKYTGKASFAPTAMVASSNRNAAEAGLEVLQEGGNAVDAAVATGFALAVSYPEAGNIGGGGYMVIRMADGRIAALDYRETAPAAATRNMYVDSAGSITSHSINGRSASGIPGTVAGLLAAHAKYGVLPLGKVMAPAIRLADGMTVDSALARSIAGSRTKLAEYSGGEVFLASGKPPSAGSRIVQADLAATLRAIAASGTRGFYRGSVARLIVDEMNRGCPPGVSARAKAAHGCGLITLDDLASYKPAWRTPIQTKFRGYTLLSMSPSSSGGITVGQTLNILDGMPHMPPFASASYIHLLASAFQRAFIDRNEFLGDPDFVKVPVAKLSSAARAAMWRSTIDTSRAGRTLTLMKRMREGMETTHYSVVDKWGNAVATTTTLNALYGSGVFVKGAGFFMNNTMDDFASQPGTPNMFGLIQGEANAIAPGKRALSAMSPTVVLDPQGKLFMVLGARGGPRIITSTAQVILNVVENGMTLSDAVNAPRIHHQALPDTIRTDSGGFDAAVTKRLEEMGWILQPQGYIGGSVVAIMRSKGGWEGMDDSRGFGGGAVGY
jgi:gamma-glutamyltranspeptidase/glutathione hydrolase